MPHTPVTYDEIQAKEQDLPSLFSKDELLLCDDAVTYREQIERSFLLNVVNKNDLPPRLDDPAPFLHSSANSIPIPEVKIVDWWTRSDCASESKCWKRCIAPIIPSSTLLSLVILLFVRHTERNDTAAHSRDEIGGKR